MGPFTHDQACHMLAEGKLQSWDLCWRDGARDWIALDQIPGVTEKSGALREQRRAEAIARYERVRALPDYAESRERAKRYLKEPYRDGAE